MRRRLVLSLAFAALVVGAGAVVLWPRTPAPSSHRDSRQLILYYTLQRVDDPVIVLGDSVTEASMLPRAICGHPIVNAGLNGASTASDLGGWLAVALNGKRAALIVVALGTNDAVVEEPSSDADFAARYAALLTQLAPLAPKRGIIGIPPVQPQDRLSREFADRLMVAITRYNALLPEIARRGGADYVALDDFPKSATIDGVHLNAAGYQVWEAAVLKAAGAVCG